MAKKPAAKSLPAHNRAAGRLEQIADARWTHVERVVETIRSLGDAPLALATAERLAKRLGVSWRTGYRYRDRLQSVDEATVLGLKRGWKPPATRLSAKQEQAVEEAINALRKKPGPLRVVDLVEEVGARCRLLRVRCHSRPAIDRRLKRAKGVKILRRGVAAPGTADPRISPGSFIVSRPLDVVQIDHTPMDIVVVDDLYRQPLGKPYLTMATDVATRCVVGFVISFVPPGAGTVSLCMTLIVSPKGAWLKQLGLTGEWPMAGLPKTLHLDGAAEFKSKALRRGCGQYGIELVYRERPHYGGHIERLIGTKMSKLKALPGATGGSPKARRSYDPDKHAALTLGELEAWFAQQIVGRYHQEPHRGLKGGTPAGAWALHPAPALAPGPLKRFRIAFLPAISRTLRRDGIVFEHLRYWHPIFAQWLARRERLVLHFDPRNLSKLYVPHEGDYLEVPFADLRLPPSSTTTGVLRTWARITGSTTRRRAKVPARKQAALNDHCFDWDLRLPASVARPLALGAFGKAADARSLAPDAFAGERPGSVSFFLGDGRNGPFTLALVFGSGCVPSISRPKSAERSSPSRTFADVGVFVERVRPFAALTISSA
ncbi:MAG: DDE-type integrase/transposase/recombinase [Methylibium sp.]|nr:DDE-type integrase/transposase/recombinase [Methylibium sp.]MBA3597233.1 DDE-type integrase/transposase/recombinase [Methylibium sp.]